MTDASPCPCGSGQALALCCGPVLARKAVAGTAEALMRSRYSAYVMQDIAYLKETLWPKYQPGFDEAATGRWASESRWTGLKVLQTTGGGPDDRDGTVLFEARYLSCAQLHTHRELSRFRKKSGRWYYVEAMEET